MSSDRRSSSNKGNEITSSGSMHRQSSSRGPGQMPNAPSLPRQTSSRVSTNGPRLSHTGSMSRRSTRQSYLGGGSEAGQVLVVFDPDQPGVDRTPKPLASMDSSISALKGKDAQAFLQGLESPASESGDLRMLDRLGSMGSFNLKSGFESGRTSGATSPKSEMDDEYELQQRQKEKKRQEAEEIERARAIQAAVQLALNMAAEQEVLSDSDLEKNHYIELGETETLFVYIAPSVTVAVDSEEAKIVEEANKRYSALLHLKLGADKFADNESQTLDLLRKGREVQSEAVKTVEFQCQATVWDIADSMDKAASQGAEGDNAQDAINGLSISQMAGSVTRASHAGSSMFGASGSARASTLAGGGGGSRRSTNQTGGQVLSHEPTSKALMPSMSKYPRSESLYPAGSSYDKASEGGSSSNNNLPEGVALEGGGVGEPALPQLDHIKGLQEALEVMDAALAQNTFLPHLLSYRGIRKVAQPPPPTPPPQPISVEVHHTGLGGIVGGARDGMSVKSGGGISRGVSRAVSRAVSRVPSAVNLVPYEAAGSVMGSEAGTISRMQNSAGGARSGLSLVAGMTGGNGNSFVGSLVQGDKGKRTSEGGDRHSVAESAWPEELLQDLADLGPDGAPRMEVLWDWDCPLPPPPEPEPEPKDPDDTNQAEASSDADHNHQHHHQRDPQQDPKGGVYRGLQVSCMAWNKVNKDLLAVGYGSSSFNKATSASAAGGGGGGGEGGGGLIAFFSLKNPGYPLRHYETRAGVTSVDFSTYSPNILAAGLYDGSVCIFDVKTKATASSPIMESVSGVGAISGGKHSDPVWKVKWLDRGQEQDEPLVSISSDGRVVQWSISKGLESSDLMNLKRVNKKPVPISLGASTGSGANTLTATGRSVATLNPSNDSKGVQGPIDQDPFISRIASGFSFDFSSKDHRVYIAGTEDGFIHKCSTSYAEQYLESYEGHLGPVYGLQWSPFRKDMFLSSSGDWTLRMWQEGRDSSLLLFNNSNHAVNDVQWCPTNSTVFGDVTSGGRLEIWDFELSTVKPVLTHRSGIPLSCLLFSNNSPVVVCGGEDGKVTVLRTFNVDREYETHEEQLARLDQVINDNVMKKGGAQEGAALH